MPYAVMVRLFPWSCGSADECDGDVGRRLQLVIEGQGAHNGFREHGEQHLRL